MSACSRLQRFGSTGARFGFAASCSLTVAQNRCFLIHTHMDLQDISSFGLHCLKVALSLSADLLMFVKYVFSSFCLPGFASLGF